MTPCDFESLVLCSVILFDANQIAKIRLVCDGAPWSVHRLHTPSDGGSHIAHMDGMLFRHRGTWEEYIRDQAVRVDDRSGSGSRSVTRDPSY